MFRRLLFVVLALLGVTSCQPATPTVYLALNPWPGYELLYLAEQEGLFKKHNLSIRLLHLATRGDVKRAFIQGRANAMATSLVEAVQATQTAGHPLAITLVTDYSNGANAIIATENVTSLSQLKGKTIATELSGLGIFFLQLALQQEKLTVKDVDIIHVEQLELDEFFADGRIDAATTYRPFYTPLQKYGLKTLFSSREIPSRIMNVISVQQPILDNDPLWTQRFQAMWQEAYQILKSRPEETYRTLAKHQGVSPLDFTNSMKEVSLLSGLEQNQVLAAPSLTLSIEYVCATLMSLNTGESIDCDHIRARLVPRPTPIRLNE